MSATGALRAMTTELFCVGMKHEQISEQLVVRVRPTVREVLVRAASAQGGRSIASVVRQVLDQWASEQSEREAA